jgi:hypothetical protein
MRTCPLGHSCNSCLWQVRLRGQNPQTGQEVDDDKCALAWLPILLVENSQQQRQTAAAVESFRNTMVQDNGALGHLMQNLLERPQ